MYSQFMMHGQKNIKLSFRIFILVRFSLWHIKVNTTSTWFLNFGHRWMFEKYRRDM